MALVPGGHSLAEQLKGLQQQQLHIPAYTAEAVSQTRECACTKYMLADYLIVDDEYTFHSLKDCMNSLLIVILVFFCSTYDYLISFKTYMSHVI